MKRLAFNCCDDLTEKIESILEDFDDKNCLISVYGKYDIIKVVLENLITNGFTIANEIELEDYDISHYDKEFVLYVTEDGVNVEKAYRNESYLYGSEDVSFVHEDCSSVLLKYIDSNKIYEFGYVDEDDCDEVTDSKHEYIVNGENVDKETFDNYVSKFAPNRVDKKKISDNDGYSISVKCDLDADEALAIIKDMEKRMVHMNDIFREMDRFRRLFNW